MPEPRVENATTRFARESEMPSKSPPAKPARRKKTEAVVDAEKLLDRLAEVTSEAERSRIRLEHEHAKRESLQAALEKERATRAQAERALAQAKTAGAKLSAELKAETATREQARAISLRSTRRWQFSSSR
jgi:chromosome segregation ATPase